jgi:Skp family chaperone for outer membrane proteins
MTSYRFAALAILTGLLASGCRLPNTPPQSRQPLVVDLNAVARALGRDELMQQKLDGAYRQLNDQLSEIGSKLEKQLADRKAALKPDADEKQEDFDKLALQANRQLRQTQQLARQKGALYGARLVNEFRQEVLGVAKGIAEQRGAASIVVANNELLWHSSSIDITDEVIGALRARSASRGGDTPGADQPLKATSQQTIGPDSSSSPQDKMLDGAS